MTAKIKFQPLCAALIAAALAAPAAAGAAPPLKLYDTLACRSKNPARKLFAVVGRMSPYGQDQTVVGISLIDQAPGALVLPQADFLPVDMAALLAACPDPAPAPLPLGAHFEDGFTEWRLAFDAGEGGVFKQSVDEIDDILQGQVMRAQVTSHKP
jgi:hypothetical protein